MNDLAISFYTPLVQEIDWDSLILRLQVFNAALMRICGVLSNGIVCVMAMALFNLVVSGYGVTKKFDEDDIDLVFISAKIIVVALIIGSFSYLMAKITSKCQRMTKLLNTQDNSRLKCTNLRLMLTLPLVSYTCPTATVLNAREHACHLATV